MMDALSRHVLKSRSANDYRALVGTLVPPFLRVACRPSFAGLISLELKTNRKKSGVREFALRTRAREMVVVDEAATEEERDMLASRRFAILTSAVSA